MGNIGSLWLIAPEHIDLGHCRQWKCWHGNKTPGCCPSITAHCSPNTCVAYSSSAGGNKNRNTVGVTRTLLVIKLQATELVQWITSIGNSLVTGICVERQRWCEFNAHVALRARPCSLHRAGHPASTSPVADLHRAAGTPDLISHERAALADTGGKESCWPTTRCSRWYWAMTPRQTDRPRCTTATRVIDRGGENAQGDTEMGWNYIVGWFSPEDGFGWFCPDVTVWL